MRILLINTVHPCCHVISDCNYFITFDSIIIMLGKVLQNYGSLTIMRVVSRLFQFALKTYLIRTTLDEDTLGQLVGLEFIVSTSLHVVKTSLKPSYQKVEDEGNIVKSAMNIMTGGVIVTMLCSALVGLFQFWQYSGSGRLTLYYPQTILLYAASAVCEAIAEKYMVECTVKYQYLKIGVIEVISIIPKTVFIFLAARHDLFPQYGILLFGVGALLYSLVFMTAFFIASSNKSLFLHSYQYKQKVIYIDPASKQSLKDFTGTAILKYFLHEFEKVVLVLMDVAHISSIYSLISNLGSMVVRYLFAPLNEIIFNYFSRGDGKESVGALVTFIKSVALFSMLVISFGYNYSQIFLTFLYGQKWVSEESVAALRTYMLLVVFLGFNGVMEAFLFAKGTAIMRYNFFSVITTCIYLASTFGFTYGGLGAAGLFLGNILNMALRIILCWLLEISHHITLGELLMRVRPSLLFVIVSAIIFLAGHKEYGVAQKVSSNNFLQFLLGAALFGINLLPVLFENRQIIIKYMQQRLLKRAKTE